MIFVNFLVAMIVILQLTPFLALLGVELRILGTRKENKKEMFIPRLTLLLSIVLIAVFLSILFSFQFGG